MKTAEKREAKLMRSQGKSLAQISKDLKISKSTASLWVRDIELTEEQKNSLLRSTGPFKGGDARREHWQKIRSDAQQAGKSLALDNNSLFAMGCMLYWAEGSKSRHSLVFTNSDPNMMQFFMRFLRESLCIKNEEITLYCNFFDDIKTANEIENFWLESLSLPRGSLRKSMINHYSKSSQKVSKNKLEYGTCRIVVNNVVYVQTIYGGIQQLAGFSTDKWN